MTTTTSSSTPCVPGALPGGLLRTSLADGMILDHDDLSTEQRYWRLKRRLTNRALGAGVVWGLKLSYDDKANVFTLSPGYAIDCCGNDVIVQETQTFKASALFDPTSQSFIKAFNKSAATQLGGMGSPKAGPIAVNEADLGVIVKYVECPEQPRAVLADACSTDTSTCATSRVRETAKLDVCAPPSAPSQGPVAKFLANLQTAMNDPAKNAQVLADVFPGNTKGPSSGPMAGPASLPLSLHIRLGREERVVPLNGNNLVLPGVESVIAYDGTVNSPTQAELTFELRPDAGYVLLDGTEVWQLGNQGGKPMPGSSSSITAPFALDLTWKVTMPLPPPAAFQPGIPKGGGGSPAQPPEPVSASAPIGTTTLTVSYGKFFGGGRTSVAITIGPVTNLGGGQSPAQVTITPLVSSANQPSDALVSLSPLALTWAPASDPVSGTPNNSGSVLSCLSSLQPGALFLDSAFNQSGDPKSLLLAAMYVWLKLSLDGNDGTDPRSYNGGQTTAAWMYLTAWRLLFGANPAAPDPDGGDRAYLGQLLDSLFHQWCDGFFYPGPTCRENHHGVFLGTASVSPAGSIVDFSAWKNRRYVLTGPLMTHWMGQVGLAPVDVIASRFLQAVCCFSNQASVALGAMTELDLAEMNITTPNVPPTFSSEKEAAGGIVVSDGFYLYFGDQASAENYFDAIAIQRRSTQGVGSMTLLSKLVAAFLRTSHPGPNCQYDHYYANGGAATLHVLIAADGPAPAPKHDRVRARVELEVRDAVANGASFSALARPVAIDWLSELLWNLPLVGLPSVPVGSVQQTTLPVLGLSTVGQAIDWGAEKLIAQLAAAGVHVDASAYTFVNALYDNIESVVSSLVGAAWHIIASQPSPFTRAYLHDPGQAPAFLLQFVAGFNNLLTLLPTPFAVTIDKLTWALTLPQVQGAADAIP